MIAMHYPEMWGFVQFSTISVGSGVEEFEPKLEDSARWVLRQVYYKQHAWYSAHGEFTDDKRELGVTDSPFDLEISASKRLFDAWVTVEGRESHIGMDGRIR